MQAISSGTVVTINTLRHRGPAPAANAVFIRLPEAYYRYALQWCGYPHWTVEETANLITGCVPHRPMFLKGRLHQALDNRVLENENRVRAAVKSGALDRVRSRKHFGKSYLLSEQVFSWISNQGLDVPEDLLRAERQIRHKYSGDHYQTPCLEAVAWVVENFWEHANLREPPTSGAIIQALLQQFPELSGEECDLVERVTRHPLARPDD